MSFTEINVKDFIEKMNEYSHVDDILELGKTQSEKGFLYERLWDILIKFGFSPFFPRSEYTHLMGNSNTGTMKEMTHFQTYLTQKVCSGNSGGTSDISLFHPLTQTYIFISSKYPKTHEEISKQKSVDYYDIHKLISMIDDNKQIYKNFKIYLLVPDKVSVLEKVQRANKSSKYITKYMMEEQILDKNDLNKTFLLWKEDVRKNGIGYERYLMKKENLILRFHQELITQKTSILIQRGEKFFLWGCKCRSGKTYMLGGLVIKQMNIKKRLNVLIITPAPTETAPQFTEDLFHKYQEFKDFKIHHIEGSSMIEDIEVEENNIFVMSKQLLQKYVGPKTIQSIRDLNLDIICFDENHFTGTTDLSRSILSSYSSTNTSRVYLTATYHKPLKEWAIPSENQMYWDIEDEELCKNEVQISKLKEKHGEDVIQNTLQYFEEDLGLSQKEIFGFYEKMPRLHVISNLMDSQRYEKIKEDIQGTKYGFCFDALLSLNKDKSKFLYEKEVKTMLRYISGSHKETDFKEGDKSIFSRIVKTCTDYNSRLPFTQIWFLPSDHIHEISTCLKNLMKEDKILKNYNVMCINRGNKELAKKVKDDIHKDEITAKEEGKDGLILLAGNMLSLGVTLNQCDVVFLMNNTLSSDKVLQQMYRCMTEGENKKMGFVVDLNINRVLHTCIQYNIFKKDMSVEDKVEYMIKNHLINIDVDLFDNKKIDSDYVISKLMEVWKSDPIHNFQTLLRNLDNEYMEFDNETQKILNKSFTSSMKDEKVDVTIALKDKDDEGQELPSGRESSDSESDKESVKSEKVEEIQISFTKDVLPYVIPLTCILTMKNNNKDFVKMLMDIQENPELLDIFNEMCLVWWNKKDLIHIIKRIVDEFFDKNSNVYNISIQFKMSLQSLIDNPKELLELVNNCLKPKDVEKKKFGEVFTPMSFINDHMLAELEKHYLSKYGKNIYENETLKWGDTTAGMGNFPIAIYYKLMDGLKEKIVDVEERKKHIIENMLYMAEYNKKNCYMIRQIFNINNQYKLNLYEGDSLTLDIKKEFDIDQFDIVIGNPPYNEELKSTGAKALYNKFIEYYMDKSQILSFVVPSRWFSGGKGLVDFRKYMLKRDDLVYMYHFDDASKIFGNTVKIAGGINYFLKDSKHKGLCNFNGYMTKLNKYDVFVDGKYHSLIDKLVKSESLSTIYLGRFFGIETNDKRLNEEKGKNDILCYVSQQNGFRKYIDKKIFLKDEKDKKEKKDYDYWKVITARASGDGFGNTFIGNKEEVHTGSYISFKVKSEDEAKSLRSYLKCRLPNFMLTLRKSAQDISKPTCSWIPLPPLNKSWTDKEVYEYLDLSTEEISLIENTPIDLKEDKNEDDENLEEVKVVKPKKTKKVPSKKKEEDEDSSVDSFIDSILNEEPITLDEDVEVKKTKKKTSSKKKA